MSLQFQCISLPLNPSYFISLSFTLSPFHLLINDYSVQIHKVDSRGKQIKSEDDFEIDIIHVKDNSKVFFKYEKSMHTCPFLLL